MKRQFSTTEFREQCLQLLDAVPADGQLITKRGRPIAKFLPVSRTCNSLIGRAPGLSYDPNNDLLSTGTAWDAAS